MRQSQTHPDQRAAANHVSYNDIGFEPMDLSDMFLDASSIALSVEEREGCFVMTPIIDHDEAYAPSTGDCTCCLPTKPDHRKPVHRQPVLASLARGRCSARYQNRSRDQMLARGTSILLSSICVAATTPNTCTTPALPGLPFLQQKEHRSVDR